MNYDVWLILVGAIIGFVSSIGIIVVERLLDQSGSLKIYYKFIRDKNTGTCWGVHDKEGHKVLLIPVVFELQNTSNTTRVVRDLSIELYLGNEFIFKLVQIESSTNRTPFSDNYSEVAFGDNGSYSFVLEPRSIKKEQCFYSYYIDKDKTKEMDFDTIKISYFKENDKKVSYIAKSKLSGWSTINTEADHEWIFLK